MGNVNEKLKQKEKEKNTHTHSTSCVLWDILAQAILRNYLFVSANEWKNEEKKPNILTNDEKKESNHAT